MSSSLLALGQYLIGIVFIVAATTKLLAYKQFVKAVVDYQILPQRLSHLTAVVIPWLELAVGILLTLNLLTLLAAALALLLLAVFTVAQVISVIRRREVNCHCFGKLDEEKVSPHTLLRNAVLMAIALEVLVYKQTHSTFTFFFAEQVLLFVAALGVLGMYILVSQAFRTLTQIKRE